MSVYSTCGSYTRGISVRQTDRQNMQFDSQKGVIHIYNLQFMVIKLHQKHIMYKMVIRTLLISTSLEQVNEKSVIETTHY